MQVVSEEVSPSHEIQVILGKCNEVRCSISRSRFNMFLWRFFVRVGVPQGFP